MCLLSDVSALGVVVCGLDRVGQSALFGVVEALFRALSRSIVTSRAAGQNQTPEEGEGRTQPSGVQREPEGHQAVFMMSSDRKPHRRHQTAQRCTHTTNFNHNRLVYFLEFQNKSKAVICRHQTVSSGRTHRPDTAQLHRTTQRAQGL